MRAFFMGVFRMYKKMIDVKIGDRVWSELLGEYFTVESIAVNGDIVTLHEGIFSLNGKAWSIVAVW